LDTAIKKTAKLPRLVYLDVLRAVAIVMVIGHHRPEEWARAGRWLAAWFKVGWAGVDLFFVLSGFLIGGLLFEEYKKRGHIHVLRFYVRRGFKIWPAYLIFLIVATIFSCLQSGSSAGALQALRATRFNWLHLQNFFGSPYSHTWSLAVEEHFYLVLPLMLLLLSRLKPGMPDPFRWMLLICIVAAGCCLIGRIHEAKMQPFSYFRVHFNTFFRIDTLLLGVALAYCVAFHRDAVERLRPWRLVLLIGGAVPFALIVVLPYIDLSPFVRSWGYTMLAAGGVAVVLWAWFASTGPAEPGRLSNGIARIGSYSYSIYLWHFPFGPAILAWIGIYLAKGQAWWWGPRMGMLVFVGVAVMFGMIGNWVIETPFLNLRDRLTAKRPAARVATTSPPHALPAAGSIGHGVL
jgi:peptidoglycan/LPS O-acetylase OafA/YrhL